MLQKLKEIFCEMCEGWTLGKRIGMLTLAKDFGIIDSKLFVVLLAIGEHLLTWNVDAVIAHRNTYKKTIDFIYSHVVCKPFFPTFSEPYALV